MHFENAGVVAIIAGAFCGQFFEYRFFVNTGLMNSSAWLWWRSPPLKIVLRLVLSTVMFHVCLAPMAFADGLEKQVSEDSLFPRSLVLLVFHRIVPYFLASFVAFGLLRYVSFRLRLDNQEVQG